MKSFILDRCQSSPTLTNVQDEKIPIYDSVACACADLSNLEEGQIISTDESSNIGATGTNVTFTVVGTCLYITTI